MRALIHDSLPLADELLSRPQSPSACGGTVLLSSPPFFTLFIADIGLAVVITGAALSSHARGFPGL